jgi:hypothetical protein
MDLLLLAGLLLEPRRRKNADSILIFPLRVVFWRMLHLWAVRKIWQLLRAVSDVTYMPAVKFFACLEVCTYLILNENPHFAKGSSVSIFKERREPLIRIHVINVNARFL